MKVLGLAKFAVFATIFINFSSAVHIKPQLICCSLNVCMYGDPASILTFHPSNDKMYKIHMYKIYTMDKMYCLNSLKKPK